jgi:hypothetical protein
MNPSLIQRRHHCLWRVAKFRPMFGTQGLWAGRGLYYAISTVTRDLSFFRSHPSPLTTPLGTRGTYSKPDPHGAKGNMKTTTYQWVWSNTISMWVSNNLYSLTRSLSNSNRRICVMVILNKIHYNSATSIFVSSLPRFGKFSYAKHDLATPIAIHYPYVYTQQNVASASFIVTTGIQLDSSATYPLSRNIQ